MRPTLKGRSGALRTVSRQHRGGLDFPCTSFGPFRGRNGRLKNSGEVFWASSLAATFAFCVPSLQTFAPVPQLSERRASNAEVAGEIPAGSASLQKLMVVG